MSRGTILAAVGLDLALAALLAFPGPGLHYDEALFLRDAVHLLHGQGPPPFTHEGGSWLRVGTRWLPLMDLPYAGAAKAYLMLLPYAVFGTSPAVARVVAALLGGLGIWGMATLVRERMDPLVACVFAFALAVHPTYLDQCVFDNSLVAAWMAASGIACLAVGRYLRRPSAAGALAAGVALGLALWVRLNFIWLLGAVAVAALLVSRAWRALPRAHVLPLAAGGLLAVSPVLAYEALSGGGTLRFQAQGTLPGAPRALLAHRLHMLRDTLVADGEHRALWGGAPLPAWLPWAALALVLASAVLCALVRAPRAGSLAWRRGAALALVLAAAVMFASRLTLAEHHLVALVPLAVLAVSLALVDLARRAPAGRWLALVVLAGYVAVASVCDAEAVAGLRRTRGVGMWSDAITRVEGALRSRHPGRTVEVLDWGLANGLYVLSSGSVALRERYWLATPERGPGGRPWTEELGAGGLFLLTAPGNANFPEPGRWFREALAASGARYGVERFTQRDGAAFAELFDVAPAR